MRRMYENTFGEHLRLEGAIAHFIDYISDELKSNLEDETSNCDYLEGTFTGTLKFEDGSIYKVEIWSDEEWQCRAFIQ